MKEFNEILGSLLRDLEFKYLYPEVAAMEKI